MNLYDRKRTSGNDSYEVNLVAPLYRIVAICINQCNPEERSQQVQSLRLIYSKAEEVLVYLGEGLDRSSPTYVSSRNRLGSLETIAISEDKHAVPPTSIDDLAYDRLIAQDCAEISESNRPLAVLRLLADLANINSDDHINFLLVRPGPGEHREHRIRIIFEWLRELLRCSWWRRVWVVQEVLAQQVTVIYGHTAISWKSLARAAKNWTLHSTTCCSDATKKLSSKNMNVLDRFAKMEQTIDGARRESEHRANPGREWDVAADRLLDLLRRFRGREASDERDQIYALLRLVDYSLIPVDYSRSAADVFTYTTTQLVNVIGDLCIILDQQERAKRLPNLPSWVPDWSSSLQRRRNFARLYNAAQGTQALEEKNVSPHLTLRMIRLDVIGDLEAAMPPTERCDWEILSEWSRAVRIKSRTSRDPSSWDI